MTPNYFSKGIAILAAFFSATAYSQSVVQSAPPGGSAETIYRQVMPDGRIIYADRPLPGARVDSTIKIDRPIKGNVWGVESGANPPAPIRSERTPVKKIAAAPSASRKMTVDEAAAAVMRAEMLLEDAKKQQEEGVEPLPGERTGTVFGYSRLNEAYQERQKLLAKYVSYAEEALKQAIQDWNRVR